ncbi:hypothetical protein D9758_000980 [Tetrapyrgos nigripes]|uniref:SAPS-domain-containing protein n=1 Tax=Tetrapyrgos nigripes TaxID=182062 RepID=A0A8H5GZ10_9AGAR|nr:hypothetical protein D9758_000980 [Tetrapyrgos nigripes]
MFWRYIFSSSSLSSSLSTTFYRFGFHNASTIDSLLDKDQVNLESILEEDDLLQECKAQNTRLIEYLGRIDVLKQLFGYITGQIEGQGEGRQKYPFTATQVLCSEIWSVVETCISHQEEILGPFWDAILDLSYDERKTRQAMAGHFAKINAVFLSKKPTEMLEFIRRQPSIVERILRHVDNASIVDLLVRIIQLDDYPGGEGVLEWLSSEDLMGKLLSMLSPAHPPDTHQVVADLIKGIISFSSSSSPAPSMSLPDSMQPNSLPSNRFARQLARPSSIQTLASYIFFDFSPSRNVLPPNPFPVLIDPSKTIINEDGERVIPPEELHRINEQREKEREARLKCELPPTFESATSSIVQSIGVVTELIRKNNSDYFEPYLFHTLRNRLIQVQQQQQHGLEAEEGREVLERAMKEMVDRMGVVHLGPLLETASERMDELIGCLRKPRTLSEPLPTTVPPPLVAPAPHIPLASTGESEQLSSGYDSTATTTGETGTSTSTVPETHKNNTTTTTTTPLTFERFRICELLAELLHCSNMAILNRDKEWGRLYDEDGKLQGGLGALEELARLVSFGGAGQEDEEGEGDDRDREGQGQSQGYNETHTGHGPGPGGTGRGGHSNHRRMESESDMDMELEPALELPVSGAGVEGSGSGPSRHTYEHKSKDKDRDVGNEDNDEEEDEDEVMGGTSSDEPGSSTDEEVEDDETMETMEEIVMEQEEEQSLSKEKAQDKTKEGLTSNRVSGSDSKTEGIDIEVEMNDAKTLRGAKDEDLVPGEKLKKRFLDLRVLGMLLDLFFEFPWNNFLHNAVYDIFHQILTGHVDSGYNKELAISLFRDAKLMHRIVEGQKRNDEEVSKPKGVRLGYMGHLTLMAEDVITSLERFPFDLRQQIIEHAPNPEWNEYVAGRYNETKSRDTALLGGGKPVIGPGMRVMGGEAGGLLGGSAGAAGSGNGGAGEGRTTRWKVDEDEPNTLTLAPITGGGDEGQGGIKGEFRRSMTGKPTREASADFGVAPMDDMDDGDDGGDMVQLSRFGSTVQDGFGDSDDEDDDSGWLSKSTFSLRNPPTLSGLQERQPLPASGFDDAFDPNTSSARSDPFSPGDDDGFGPFSDSSAVGGADPFTFSSSSSDEMDDFGGDSFGDFGDFQSGDDGESDGQLTPTAGSWTEFGISSVSESSEVRDSSKEGDGTGEEDSLNLKGLSKKP